MPFVNDTTWSERLKAIFTISRAENDPFKNRYYGPYDKMMNYCFGEDFDFFIAPQAPLGDTGRETVEFVVYLLVSDIQKPVLLIEVKDDTHINSSAKRQAADEQMRGRYNELLYQCPIPILYGLSVLGTKMRVYSSSGDIEQGKVYPPRVPIDPEHVLDQEHLAEEWSIDILSNAGFSQMKEIVGFIKQESAALQAY
jgi:hypothetical protein